MLEKAWHRKKFALVDVRFSLDVDLFGQYLFKVKLKL